MPKSREFLERVLVCPESGLPLRFADGHTLATATGVRYPVQAGVPILRPVAGPVRVQNRDHQSNPIPREHAARMRACEGLVLNIGAGSSDLVSDHIVQFEYTIFATTDVVGDAHRLPFATDLFDLVVAFNVFEHLREPALAAEQIRRVLRPAGELIVHTAFLQPLHEAPAHYYNATEFGIREWFKGFAEVECDVSPNFAPHYSLAWIAAEILAAVEEESGPDARRELGSIEIEKLAEFWANRHDDRFQAAFDAFQRIPEDAKRRTAAGFEVRARKQ